MDRIKHNKGFTLVEVILVLVMAALVAAIAVPSISGYIENSGKSKCRTLLNSMSKEVYTKLASTRFSSTEEVSLEIYRIIDKYSFVGLTYDTDKTEISETFALSPSYQTSDGERVTVKWGFSDDGLDSVSYEILCEQHEVSLKNSFTPNYGGTLTIIITQTSSSPDSPAEGNPTEEAG